VQNARRGERNVDRDVLGAGARLGERRSAKNRGGRQPRRCREPPRKKGNGRRKIDRERKVKVYAPWQLEEKVARVRSPELPSSRRDKKASTVLKGGKGKSLDVGETKGLRSQASARNLLRAAEVLTRVCTKEKSERRTICFNVKKKETRRKSREARASRS